MELWIPITIAAAFTQNLRVALQKHLTGRLTALGATYTRFVMGLPFAILYFWLISSIETQPLPLPNGTFLLFGSVGGIAQILATLLLLIAFQYRNFAVGTAYSKTETIQTAIVGVVVLGEVVTLGATLGILVSLAGVLVISAAKSKLTARGLLLGWTERAALIGLASGTLFGVSAVSYRAASLALDHGSVLLRASMTLVCVLAFQTTVMAIFLGFKDRSQLVRVLQEWRWTFWVGLTSMVGSACWFTAMTLQNAAYVRAVGQIELVFTFIVSALIFRERTTLPEFIGIVLVVAGILLLLLI